MLAQASLHIGMGQINLYFTVAIFRVTMITDDLGFAQKTRPCEARRHFERVDKKGMGEAEIDEALLAVKRVRQKIDAGYKQDSFSAQRLDAAIYVVHLTITGREQYFYTHLML